MHCRSLSSRFLRHRRFWTLQIVVLLIKGNNFRAVISLTSGNWGSSLSASVSDVMNENCSRIVALFFKGCGDQEGSSFYLCSRSNWMKWMMRVAIGPSVRDISKFHLYRSRLKLHEVIMALCRSDFLLPLVSDSCTCRSDGKVFWKKWRGERVFFSDFVCI